MGRKRKYFTAEERVAANRAKSKKHYEKAKEQINKKKRRQYKQVQRQNLNLRRSSQENLNRKTQQLPEPKPVKTPVQVWVDQAQRLKRRFNEYILSDPIAFTAKQCAQYLAQKNIKSIADCNSVLDHYQERIHRYQNSVYGLTGLGPEYNQLKTIALEVDNVHRWVEEIHMAALIGYDEVKSMYARMSFEFQTDLK
ncbi:hypothetical protein JR316_0010332 [Psilocybe cubensis]|uniref:Uncharacterized protein n=2 Tax=Psilocybe cubensis TaxID=181762 RepID=A0A8H8CGQ8_PSICU|nr:hypothetical protein JR316_0010332 [Psilocybe cubensis]KAH9478094.1 hypothetical protein JR316_0010332 [Psilocybe cubensis]